jgi:cysteine synthase B
MSYLKTHSPDIFNTQTSSRSRVNSLLEEELAESKEIDGSELNNWIDDGAIVIDIRGNFAFSRGHIPNSINILDELLTQIIEEGPVFPQSKKICIVCSVGTISRKFAAFLRAQGYEAASLKGGLSAWKRGNFAPLSTSLSKVFALPLGLN